MTETKVDDPVRAIFDDPPEHQPPATIDVSPELTAELAELEEQERGRQREWDAVIDALRNNSLAVIRAMRRFRHEGAEEQVERVLSSVGDGSFLIDRLGACGTIDQDLTVVLLDLRRRLIDEYGDGPAAMVLIDGVVAAHQDFIRISGWTGNAALMVEHEFFGADRPSANVRDRHGREVREIHGLTVEEHINRLGQDLIPLAERCSRIMREALVALEALRAGPSEAVERSRPVSISLMFAPHPAS